MTKGGYKTYLYEEYEQLYLDYMNKFDNFEQFVNYYDMTNTYAIHVLNIGKKIHLQKTLKKTMYI
jgi:hypothetical protein